MSEIEDSFEFILKVSKIEGWVREYHFNPNKRSRFDFAWPELKIALEIEGGIWNRGAHVRGIGYTRDCDKCNEALLLGWKVLRVTSEHVKSGRALQWIEKLLKIEV